MEQNINEMLQIKRDKLAELKAQGNDPHVIEMIDDMLKHVKHEIKGEPHPRNLYK